MNFLMNLLEAVAVIGSADGPTSVFVAGDLPLPAITLVAVVIVLLIYTHIAKAVRSKKAAAAAPETTETALVETPAAPAPAAAPVQKGVELVGVDEKTAAVIMAIVSDETGIPLNRLDFKSIKLMEDK